MSNSDEDIRIEFTTLEPGWEIKGSTVKVTNADLVVLKCVQNKMFQV